jgi:AraC-like DNA-binding protein
MNIHRTILSQDDRIAEMLSQDYDIETIAARLQMSVQHVEVRFKVICAKLGGQAK